MKNRKIMSEFLNSLNRNNKLTSFFKIIFNYEVLNDYNYISRFAEIGDSFIIDIYDNVSDNRFNRYIFNFNQKDFSKMVKNDGDVIVTFICVNANYVPLDNVMKLAYMFSNHNNDIAMYARTFLPDDIIDILLKIVEK